MKFIILGYGSMGKRHAKNLKALRPDAQLVVADPHPASPISGGLIGEENEYALFYRDWVRACEQNADARGVIIASPINEHLAQMRWCVNHRLPFLVEKPPCGLAQVEEYAALLAPPGPPASNGLAGGSAAVGFCYRFHPVAPPGPPAKMQGENLAFYAQDDLVRRYGRTVTETMASHAVDLALWRNGPGTPDFRTDGVRFWGELRHANGAVSTFDLNMAVGPRVSVVGDRSLYADEGMYMKEMQAWLQWVLGGEKDERLATLAEGLAVMEALRQTKITTKAHEG